MIRFKPYLEYKYPITIEQKERFLEEISNTIIPDSFGNNGIYQISSLYYDTDQFDFFYDKLEGEFFKVKIRLRRYRNDSSSNWSSPKLEIKTKKAFETIKISKSLTEAEERYFQNTPITAFDLLTLFNDPKLPLEKLSGKVFRPTVDIVYTRQAYYFNYLPDTRVTFDSKIFASKKQSINEYDKIYENKPIIFDKNQEILEIKSNTKIPDFLLVPLQNIGVLKENVSKYGMAIESIYSHL